MINAEPLCFCFCYSVASFCLNPVRRFHSFMALALAASWARSSGTSSPQVFVPLVWEEESSSSSTERWDGSGEGDPYFFNLGIICLSRRFRKGFFLLAQYKMAKEGFFHFTLFFQQKKIHFFSKLYALIWRWTNIKIFVDF